MNEILLAPISEAAPAGTDLSYDPEFERLVAEIEKLTSLAGESPDWRFVRSACEETLREKSKDLRVMSWFVAAKANLEDWNGIVEGLDTYVALAKAFWPSLYPPLKRLRARSGQVEWLWGVLSKKIAALPASASEAEVVRSLEPRVAEVGGFFAEHLKDADPGMGPVRAALREKIRTLPEPAPPTDRAPVTPGPTAPAPVPSAAAPAPARVAAAAPPIAAPQIAPVEIDPSAVAGLDQAQDAARGLRDPLMTLAHHARRVAPSSPWSYRLLRLGLWLTIDRAPEVENGRTYLRAPRPGDRELLESLRANSQWDGLLEAAEDLAGQNLFWLDPHRMAALALDNKGPAFRQARDIVVREAAAFVERVSGVTHLVFDDGTPFANAETIDWLAASAQSGGGTTTTTAAGKDEALESLLADLDERLKSATAAEALGGALSQAERLPTPRGRFRARLAVAKQAQNSDLLDVAVLLYEGLLPEVTPTLEQWEPAIAGELFENYLKAVRIFLRNPDASPADRDDYERREALLFKRLLAVDPHAALRMRA